MSQGNLRGNFFQQQTYSDVQRIIDSAISLGADPEQAKRHFQGQPATDPLTRFLLARANPNLKGRSDLDVAVAMDLTEIAAEKLAQGGDPNQCTEDGTTPLMEAARNRNNQLTVLLLNAGAHVNVRNQLGETPLGLAASNGADQVVQLLLQNGANFNESKLLTSASYGCSPQTLKNLLDLGLDVNEDSGQPLLNATAARNIANVQVLLDRGADVNAHGGNGRTALIIATRNDDENLPADLTIVQLLLEHGADVNSKDDEGWTPLMGAARDGDDNVVRLLLANGANPNVKDRSGNTPLSLATAAGNAKIATLIRERENRQS